MRPVRRPVLALVVVALLAPAGAEAATVGLEQVGDSVAEAATVVRVSGTADPGSTLDVGYQGVVDGCRGAFFDDELVKRSPVEGSFSRELTIEYPQAGRHGLCAAISGPQDEQLARAELALATRWPRAELSITAPAVVALGHPVRVRVAGSLEAERSLFTTVVRPGHDCTSNDASVFLERPAAGPVDLSGTTRLDRFGTWTICAEVRKMFISFLPERDQDVTRTIRVGVLCTRASRALSRERDRWRSRSRALALAGRRPDRRLRRLGRAIRRARAGVGPACRPGVR